MNLIRLLCCFLLLISSLTVAEKYALLVGINDYQNDIGALKYCVADVQAFQQALIQTAGYKNQNVQERTAPRKLPSPAVSAFSSVTIALCSVRWPQENAVICMIFSRIVTLQHRTSFL